MPPYSPNVHVADLQDTNGQEYVVLVSRPLESLTIIKHTAASSINIQSSLVIFYLLPKVRRRHQIMPIALDLRSRRFSVTIISIDAF